MTIYERELISPSELREHPRNYRTHPEDQLEQLMASIREHGFYRNVVVARDNTILAGHGVVEAAKRIGLEEVAIVRLDIDPGSSQGLKILAGDNYLSHFAMDDDRALADMLRDLKNAEDNPTGLLGTGFTDMALAGLAMVTRHANEIESIDAAAEWAGAGMPEHNPGVPEISIMFRFMSEQDRDAFLDRLDLSMEDLAGRGTMRNAWWPKRERNDLAAVRVVSQHNDSDEDDDGQDPA